MPNHLPQIVSSGYSAYSAPVPDGCAQLFAPCLDPNCTRDCGARRPYSTRAIAINAKMHAAKRQTGFLEIFGLLLASGIAVSLTVGIVLQGVENGHRYNIEHEEP